MTQANRKRGRSMEDEASEFTPLSKRINNLHINGLTGLKNSVDDDKNSKWITDNCTTSSNHCGQSQSSTSCNGYSTNQMNFDANYQPDLDANDNPYYYENNKLLYSLYVERMHRRVSFNNL